MSDRVPRLPDLFRTRGQSLSLTGRSPLLLADPGYVRLVVEGTVDVFFVQMEGGAPLGPRHHCTTVEQGELLFSFSPDPRFGFVAVSAGASELRSIDSETFESWSRMPEHAAECAARVDRWVQGLTVGVITDELKTTDLELTSGADVVLEADCSVRARSSPVWVELPGHCGSYLDRRLLGPDSRGVVVPLTSRAWMWVQVFEPLRLSPRPTERALTEPGFWTHFRRLLDTLAHCARQRVAFLDAEEELRQRRSLERDQRLQEEAIAGLTASVVGQDNEPIPEREHEELVEICQIVARACGASIRVPPTWAPRSSQATATVEAIARTSRLRTRRVRLSDRWWQGDHGGMIGFLKDGHRPVALLPASPRRYLLRHPGSASEQVVTAEVASQLESDAYTLYRSFPGRIVTGRELIAFGLKGSGRDLATVAVTAALGALMGFVPPILTGTIFDTVIPFSSRGLLGQVTIGLAAAAFGVAVFELTKAFSVMRILQKANTAIECALWDRLLKVPTAFFRAYSAGDLAMRANSASELTALLKGPLSLTVLSAVFASANLVLMAHYSVQLASLGVLMIALALVLVSVLCWVQLGASRRIQALRGDIGGLVLQLITGIAKIRIAGAEIRAFARWASSYRDQVRAEYSVRKAGVVGSVFFTVYSSLCTTVLFAMLVYSSARSTMSVGAFLAFNAAFGALLAAILAMGSALVSMVAAVFLYERCLPILEARPEYDEVREYVSPGKLNGRVEVNQVCFRYDRTGDWVLHDVSLRAAPGEMIAIVGPSGSGKSTLFRLLLGFETPELGAVYLDGQDLNRLDLEGVRRQMGVVLQHGRLIPGSLHDNIAGPANVSEEEAWRAARLAGIDTDIQDMPMQMHTIVMEGGGGFSGGQKQRVMIARALAGSPRILLFDEATSALDNRTQALVASSIEALQVTRIVIAHRLSTVINADRIYVLEKGRIVQVGTSAELMAQDGPFRAMAARQLI
jgi:NHLM bacteriocin system ABC transporter ATP-binding protein